MAAVAVAVLASCKDQPKKEAESETTAAAEETKATTGDWEVLFDGTSFDGWHEYRREGVTDNWKLEDGAMVLHQPAEKEEGELHHNLVTDKEYTDFVLSLEWKISEAGNSGVFWGVKEMDNLPEAYQTGPEIQVLDNEGHPDGKNGPTHQSGALYDMIGPKEDVTKPVGEWNSFVITIDHKNNKGSIVLNGTETASFPVNDPEWSEMVAKSKFANWKEFGKFPTGKIGLQDHESDVAFRNIKIKEL